ncbi:Chitinase A precursor [Microbulbifer aggregans]|uniref:Chitinase A n=1 Tax=Microbulbifer aggregans TaxID=1769779 RepID=A0A1C9W4K3_9GAMM|nr:PKD domain-containing protein [Microbulbifer aggregans]AOS96060.1 Chitinase A precursor [Microbulbifer aggregans]
MTIKRTWLGRLAVASASILLFACGGGGGSGGNDSEQQPENQAPAVTVSATSLKEGTSIDISATATDSDGSIASYSWAQKSGLTLTLENTDSQTVTVTAPDITEDSTATLTITVTDDDGAQASADVVVTVLANIISVTLEGKVTDNPVANANILFTVGEQEFTTTADSNGLYSIALSVDDSRSADMVRAEATSTDEPQLKLVSLMGSLSSLVTAAGSDELVTREEHLPVNITNLSTALAAQVEKGEPGSISSDEELTARKKLLNGGVVFQLATLIKLVLDYSDTPSVDIPEGIMDTYSLASNRELAANLAGKIQLDNTPVYQTAINAILDDPELVAIQPQQGTDWLDDTYYFTSSAAVPAPFTESATIHFGYKLELEPQGTGILTGREEKSALSWENGANGLSISGAEFVTENYEFDNNLGTQIRVQTVIQPRQILWLDHNQQVDWIAVIGNKFNRYPDGEYPSTDPVSFTGATMAVREAGTENAKDIIQTGFIYSLPVPTIQGEVTDPSSSIPYPDFDIQAVQMIFSGSVETGGSATITKDTITGNGTPSELQLAAGWSINSDGHLLVDNVLGASAEYVFLERDDLQTPLTFVITNDGTNERSLIANGYLKEAPAWSADRAVGMYRHPEDFYTPLQPFWFEVNADGSALTVSGWDANGDNQLSSDEFSQMPGLWKINTAGNLVIRRYRELNGPYCEPAAWDPAQTDSCLLYHEREWVLHQEIDNDKIGLRHYHRFFYAPFRDPLASAPDDHELWFASIFNIYFEKIDERPFPIDSM